jgi:hypothetical protein
VTVGATAAISVVVVNGKTITRRRGGQRRNGERAGGDTWRRQRG